MYMNSAVRAGRRNHPVEGGCASDEVLDLGSSLPENATHLAEVTVVPPGRERRRSRGCEIHAGFDSQMPSIAIIQYSTVPHVVPPELFGWTRPVLVEGKLVDWKFAPGPAHPVGRRAQETAASRFAAWRSSYTYSATLGQVGEHEVLLTLLARLGVFPERLTAGLCRGIGVSSPQLRTALSQELEQVRSALLAQGLVGWGLTDFQRAGLSWGGGAVEERVLLEYPDTEARLHPQRGLVLRWWGEPTGVWNEAVVSTWDRDCRDVVTPDGLQAVPEQAKALLRQLTKNSRGGTVVRVPLTTVWAATLSGLTGLLQEEVDEPSTLLFGPEAGVYSLVSDALPADDREVAVR